MAARGRAVPARPARGGTARARPRRGRSDPARRVAFDVLTAVAERDAYANLLLPALLAAQRAVGQLGGQRRVAPGQPAVRQQSGQQQVRVRVPLGHRAQHVERHAAGRIYPAV